MRIGTFFFTQRLINLQGGLISLWLFKMPLALLHKWIGVPSYPSKCAGETEHCYNFLFSLIRKKFKTRDSMFSNSRIVFPFYKCGSEHFFTQRLINLQGGLMSLWLFKMPRALLHKWIGVPSYPSKCAGETEHCYNFLFLLIRRSLKVRIDFF